MKETIVRARCLYSKSVRFGVNRLYSFELAVQTSSYDVYYIAYEDLFAFRFLGANTRTLLIEDLDGLVAVFEIVLECTK